MPKLWEITPSLTMWILPTGIGVEWTITTGSVSSVASLGKGGKVLAGTDAGELGWATPGLGMHHELELLVEAGLSNMDALMAATRNVAQAFRQLQRLGTLEEGKLADLVILNRNPLEDITHTLDIQTVVKDGRIVDRESRSWFQNPLQIRNAVEGRTWVEALILVQYFEEVDRARA